MRLNPTTNGFWRVWWCWPLESKGWELYCQLAELSPDIIHLLLRYHICKERKLIEISDISVIISGHCIYVHQYVFITKSYVPIIDILTARRPCWLIQMLIIWKYIKTKSCNCSTNHINAWLDEYYLK